MKDEQHSHIKVEINGKKTYIPRNRLVIPSNILEKYEQKKKEYLKNILIKGE